MNLTSDPDFNKNGHLKHDAFSVPAQATPNHPLPPLPLPPQTPRPYIHQNVSIMPTTDAKSNTTGTTPATNSSTTVNTDLSQQESHGKIRHVSKSKRCKLYTLSCVAPPLAVARLCKTTQRADRNEQLTLNVILTICGIVPGIVHAVAVVHHETKGHDGKCRQHEHHYNNKMNNGCCRHGYDKSNNGSSSLGRVSKLGGSKSSRSNKGSKGSKNKEKQKMMQSRESEEELQELLRNVRHVSSNRKLTMIPEQSETSSEASVPVVAGHTGSRLSFGGGNSGIPLVDSSLGTKTPGKQAEAAANEPTAKSNNNLSSAQKEATDKNETSRGRLTNSDRDNTSSGNGNKNKSSRQQQPQHQQTHANWASKEYNPLDKQRRELPDFPWPPPSAVSATVAPTKAPLHSEIRHTLKRRSSSSIRSRRDRDRDADAESEALIASIPTETLIDILRHRDDYANFLRSSSSISSLAHQNNNMSNMSNHHHQLLGIGGGGGYGGGTGTASATASIRRKMSRDSLRSFRSSYSDFPQYQHQYHRDRDRDRDWDDWDDGSSLSSMPVMPVMMGRF